MPQARLEAVGLLAAEALEAFLAAGVVFHGQPDRLGLGGTPWAAIELGDGTHYVLVHHDHAPEPLLEVRAAVQSATPAELVERLCRAVDLDRPRVLAVEGEPNDELGALEALPAEGPLDRLVFRARHRPRRYMWGAAMDHIPVRYVSYPSPAQRPSRAWRPRLPRCR